MISNNETWKHALGEVIEEAAALRRERLGLDKPRTVPERNTSWMKLLGRSHGYFSKGEGIQHKRHDPRSFGRVLSGYSKTSSAPYHPDRVKRTHIDPSYREMW